MIGLTVFILHCGNDSLHRPNDVRESFDMPDCTLVFEDVPSGTPFIGLFGEMPWKMFIYSNERLSHSLNKELPLYLAQPNFNVLSLFRMDNNDCVELEEMKISICPRIFRTDIILKQNSIEVFDPLLIPVINTNILDGFLIGEVK